ncbi:spore germination protein [Sporosarcina luteola]|uniref:GerAB/ArcD/ProY family transporter n=1 Tax=Bacillales TaxID=1385 RepID=UPI00203EE0B0|nr:MULTISPECIES: GerAB/ArcD/ProY family transporter [Bacillales]MCM3639185.1 spore germination protein [Sporosarcina luteola]
MNRFLIYLILINTLTNMVSITPRILIAGGNTGTVLGMAFAISTGIVLTYFLVILFSRFPGQGLPEILKAYTPKWFAVPVLLFMAAAWYVAGLFTLMIYTFIILRFLTPEMSIYTIVLTFALVVTYGVLMATRNIIYMSEVIFILVVPFIVFVQMKGYLDPSLNWDYIRIALMQVNQLPDYGAFTSSLFIVIGTANLVIFNRAFTTLKKPTLKGMAILTVAFMYILATTYLLPIGFGGFDSLENALYPWIMTSDSIRMKFGVVERIVFIFIGSFLALGVVSMIIHWHVSIHLFSSVFQLKRLKWKSYNLTLPLFIVFFWIVAMTLTKRMTVEGLYRTVEMYDDFVLPAMLILLVGSLLLAKKGASSKWRENKK